MRKNIFLVNVAIFLLLPNLAFSNENKNIFTREKLSGNWGGFRDKLTEKGIDIELTYKADILTNARGGTNKKTCYLDNKDIKLSFDLEKLTAWKGGTFFLYTLGNSYRNSHDFFVDAQGISNIRAPNAWKVYEMWLEQNLLKDKISLKCGIYDLNSEFDSKECGSIFLHSSHGIGTDFSQSGQNGPSIFPNTSLAARISVMPVERFYIQSAVLDAAPGKPGDPEGTHFILKEEEGALIVSETGFLPDQNEEGVCGKFAVGGWHYLSRFDDILDLDQDGNPLRRENNYGLYALADKRIYQSKIVPERNVMGYVRLGWANPDINRFDSYIGGGVRFNGMIPVRKDDQFGIAFGRAHNGDKYRWSQENQGISTDTSETDFELTYRAQITSWLILKPDFQYIIHPNTDPLIEDTIVVGFRFEISL